MNVKKSRSAGGNSKADMATKKQARQVSVIVAQDDNMVDATMSIQDCDIDAEIFEVAQEYDRRMKKAVNDCENSLKGGD